MDLFTPVVSPELQHPNFRYITKPGFFEPESEVLKNWAKDFVDRDNKFVKEFQTTFNSSFWELYLFAFFNELKCKANFKYSSPDFVLTSPYGEFIAEATTANHPLDHRPEWDRDGFRPEETEMDDILRLSTLRLLQVITEKFKKFKDSYSKLTHVQNKPFVICVSPFEQPLFFVQDCLAIIRVLYAYDRPLISESHEGELFIVGESRKHEVHKKPNTKEIPLGLFTNENMADVSAIIFNNRATICKVRALAGEGKYPVIFYGSRAIESETETGVERFYAERPHYQETLLDGCHVLFNPFAKHPLDQKLFEGKEIAIHNYDPQTHTYQLTVPNGFLYQRVCRSFSCETEEALNNYQAATPSTKAYKELPPEIWPEDKLYEVGKNILFSENHMGHYCGWTILVSLDSTDQDWSALAVNILCYSYPNFREAYGDDNIPSTSLLGEWLATKEEAYTAIKCKIDEILEQA
jgi:hypothetical protein